MKEALRASTDLNMAQFKEKLAEVVDELKEEDRKVLQKKSNIRLYKNLKPDSEGWTDNKTQE